MGLNQELVRKADIALANLSGTGGQLTVEQQDAFFRKILVAPTLLSEMRRVFMTNPTMEINKVGFGSRILKVAPTAAPSESRLLAATDRVMPDLGKVTLTTSEVMAELHIPYDVLEDNIERDDFSDTLMDMAAERTAVDLEELCISGSSGTGGTYLELMDGVLELATSNVVSAGSATISKTVFRDAVKAMPDQFLRNRKALRHYIGVDNELTYRDTIADRQTAAGDQIIQGFAPVYAFGTPVVDVSQMPAANSILTDPKNLIVGFHRNVLVETDKDIRARNIIIVITMRIAFQIEEEIAVVKVTNLG
jgi:HK97 family phage major capsid protein